MEDVHRWLTLHLSSGLKRGALFEENVELHEPLLPVMTDEDRVAVTRAGGIPLLGELRLRTVVSKGRRASPPKYQLAEALYRDNPGLRRKDYITGMAPHYAAGFLYHLKRYGGVPVKSET